MLLLSVERMPLPLGEVSSKVTERARTPTEKREDGDNFALTKRLLIAVRRSALLLPERAFQNTPKHTSPNAAAMPMTFGTLSLNF